MQDARAHAIWAATAPLAAVLAAAFSTEFPSSAFTLAVNIIAPTNIERYALDHDFIFGIIKHPPMRNQSSFSLSRANATPQRYDKLKTSQFRSWPIR